MTHLRLSGVTKSFGGTPVLHGIDLDIASTSLTAILGPSGCGKTTMLRIIAGFLDPDQGSISFDDRVVFDASHSVAPQHRRVGYVPQEGALFPHLDVAANIGFGLPRARRRERHAVDQLLELVGLPASMRSRKPHELSGGQQQRIALARALAPAPSIVLLDEPFASLDAGLREDTGRAVARALNETKATAILVTHDQSEALSLADQVAVMRAGRLIQVASPHDVYAAPLDAGVAKFVGAGTFLDVLVGAAGQAHSPLGPMRVITADGTTKPAGHAQVVIRPEQISLRTDCSGVTATVTEVSYYGHDAAVRLVMGGDRVITARITGQRTPEPGEVVGICVAGDVTALSA